MRYEAEYGCSQHHYRRCRDIIKDLILFLDSADIHALDGVTSDLISIFPDFITKCLDFSDLLVI